MGHRIQSSFNPQLAVTAYQVLLLPVALAVAVNAKQLLVRNAVVAAGLLGNDVTFPFVANTVPRRGKTSKIPCTTLDNGTGPNGLTSASIQSYLAPNPCSYSVQSSARQFGRYRVIAPTLL